MIFGVRNVIVNFNIIMLIHIKWPLGRWGLRMRLGWVGGSAVGECLMFLTGDLEGMVILYIMDDLVQPL